MESTAAITGKQPNGSPSEPVRQPFAGREDMTTSTQLSAIRRPAAGSRRNIDWMGYLYIAPALSLALLFSLFSMAVSFWTSLHEWDPFVGAGRFVGLDNYRRVL